MSFRKIDVVPVIDKPDVRGGIALSRTGRARLGIGLSAVALAKAGFKHGDALEALIGVDEDRGKLRLEKALGGALVLKPYKPPHAKPKAPLGSRFSLTIEELVADPRKPRALVSTCADGSIEIELPRGFFPRPTEAVLVQAPPPLPAARPQRDATASLMGDPVRGRSAAGTR